MRPLILLALTVALMARRVRGAVLLGILFATLLAWAGGLVHWQGLVAAPPSLAPTFLQLFAGGPPSVPRQSRSSRLATRWQGSHSLQHLS